MRCKKVLARRRNPDEFATARLSIRNFCLECVGYQREKVKLCTDPECWLYPWRLGKTPGDLRRSQSLNRGSFAPKTTAVGHVSAQI